jgi:hypothetical protein
VWSQKLEISGIIDGLSSVLVLVWWQVDDGREERLLVVARARSLGLGAPAINYTTTNHHLSPFSTPHFHHLIHALACEKGKQMKSIRFT